jgi:tRNA-splicing ligase RtcB
VLGHTLSPARHTGGRKAKAGVECRKEADVVDETPMAYKSIDAVMEAQEDLVELVHTLRQVVCAKGWTKEG